MRGRTETQRNWDRCYNKKGINENYRHIAALILIIIVVCASVFLYRYFQKGYYIKNMNVQVDINDKKQYRVTETINVHFYAHKHGISRVFGDSISNYYYDISDIKVKGAPFTEDRSNNFAIRIGDPDEEVIGDKKYVITYTINHYESGYDYNRRFNMDVLGNQWDSKVKKFSARINYPQNAGIEKVHAYFDRLSYGTNYIYRNNSSSIKYEKKDNSLLISCDKTIPANKGIKVKAVFSNDLFMKIPQQPQDAGQVYYNSGDKDKDYNFFSYIFNIVKGKIDKYIGGLIFAIFCIISFFRRGRGNGYYDDGYFGGDSSGGFGGGSSGGDSGGSSGGSGGGSSW